METELRRLLRESGSGDQGLVEGVETLARRWGKRVYKVLLGELTGKEFAAEEACRHWGQALAHRERLRRDPASGPGVRPVLLDYLQRVAAALHDPRLVEADALAALRHASVTDGLTGLFNQTFFKAHLDKVVARQRPAAGHGFAVLLLDLDHFKQYNDRCGHLAGDAALRRTGEILAGCIREGDLAARYGGEEFAVFLSRVTRQQAAAVAERIRRTVEAADFPGQQSLDRGNLTISGGIALYPEDAASCDALLRHADHELYRAKRQRNAIFPAGQERRRAPRRPLRSLLELVIPAEGRILAGLSLDVSEHGLAVDCDHELRTGQALEVRLQPPFWPRRQRLTAVVRHVVRDGTSGLVRLGLEIADRAELPAALSGGREGSHGAGLPAAAGA
jgi:diguanylate cyclase (GGDEF)-like protein